MKRFDVTALGELLIDFTENGKSSQGNIMMEANPGGAPCNVLAILTKLGKKTAFIGKVGDDCHQVFVEFNPFLFIDGTLTFNIYLLNDYRFGKIDAGQSFLFVCVSA